MKNKTFALFALSALMLTLIVGVASAVTLSTWGFDTTTTSNPTGVDVNLNANPLVINGVTTLQFDNDDGASAVNWPIVNSVDTTKYFEVTLSPKPGYILVVSDVSFNYSASIAGPASFALQYSKNANFASPTSLVTKTDVSTTELSSANTGLNVQVVSGETLTLRWFGYNFNAITNEFRIQNLVIGGTLVQTPTDVLSCAETGSFGDNLDVSIDDITVDEGFGGEDNDNEWFPLDTITIDVDIENNGPKDIDNVALGWGLYDKTTQKWVIDDEESDFDLNDDDTESKSLTFKLDEDVDEFDSSHDYVFYTWANGDDNEVDPNVATCDYAFQDVDMQIEEFVILDNIQSPTDAVQCNEEVTITGDAWNLDDNDQDDVYVLVTNVALGLKEQRMEVGDIDSLEDVPFAFTFKVPEGLDEKTYPITFDVYDDHDDIYENSFNEESSFMVPLTVKGNCGAVSGSATVSATLESGGKAGEAMVVKTIVTNKGTKTAEFTVNAAGYSTWASAASVSEDSFMLEAGKSKDVTITLQTKADAKGEQTLNVEVLSGNEIVMTQPVAVMVEGKSAGFLSAITGNAVGDGKSLWIIGALNVLLVFAIIVIAIRFLLRR